MDLLEFPMKLDISYYLALRNMMPFTKGLDIFFFNYERIKIEKKNQKKKDFV